MGEVLLLLVVALTVAAVVFGVTVLVSGRDPGLVPVEPDGRAVPLPGGRPLHESDVAEVRFDTTLRGYRMAQVDQAMRRAAYDIGYKSELIGVLEAEVDALRAGRTEEAEALRRAREEAVATSPSADAAGASPAEPTIDLGLAAEPGLAAAPAAAAVEAETPPITGAGSASVPVTDEPQSTARPTGDETAEPTGDETAEPTVSVRPAVDPTAEALDEPAATVTGNPTADRADAGAPTRGAVVRSEPA